MLIQKAISNIITIGILLLVTLPAYSKSPIYIKGVVTADHLDSNSISIKDQFGQIFLIPRTLIKNGNSILIGSKVELQVPTEKFKLLKKL